jgi:UDPglucose--hexose-1-phosphate uridylyltransferase
VQLERDAFTGRVSAVAPARRVRPGGGRVPAGERCPFCAGHEELTPPATLELGSPWSVRVVPNLYPAFEGQEVVVHSPDHRLTFAALADDEAARVAEAWQARRRARPEGYLHAFVNEGAAAGASREHTHSQLVWLPEPPPEVTRERGEPDLSHAIAARDGVVLAAAPAPRRELELLIAPERPDGDAFVSERLAPALALLAEGARRLRALEGEALAWNAWLHAGPWWHLEVLPRTSVLAGLELGAGVYVATRPPEEAAAALRAAGAV